jgi:hypothetical protein
MKRALTLLLGLFALAVTAAELPPAWRHWKWSRAIELPATDEGRLARATLPVAVYDKAWTDLRDLRVIDDTGAEVPFLLHARHGRKTRQQLAIEMQETSHVPGEYTQAIVDMGADGKEHNQITLGLEANAGDFVARVEVAASDDGRRWRVLREGAPVYRFQEQGLPGNQQVSYGETRARYLRLRIRQEEGGNREKFPVNWAQVSYEVVEEPELMELPVKMVTRPDTPPRQSWWQLDMGGGQVPASEVWFRVEQEEFHRPVEVSHSEDGQTWKRAGRGDIHRYQKPVGDQTQESLRVEFAERRGRHWRVVVRDRNDPPLEDVRVELWGVPRHVVFRQEPRRSYRLLHGNEAAKKAQYELRQLAGRDEIATAVRGEVGGEEENTAWADPRPWSEQHPAVLWVVLLVTIAVLGWLAIRSLRQAS